MFSVKTSYTCQGEARVSWHLLAHMWKLAAACCVLPVRKVSVSLRGSDLARGLSVEIATGRDGEMCGGIETGTGTSSGGCGATTGAGEPEKVREPPVAPTAQAQLDRARHRVAGRASRKTHASSTKIPPCSSAPRRCHPRVPSLPLLRGSAPRRSPVCVDDLAFGTRPAGVGDTWPTGRE